jgi:hypothetical protein
LLDGEATALIRKAIELALAADLLGAIKAVAGAVGRGAITAAEAVALSQMIETFLRTIDASDFEMRLRRLEERQAVNREDYPGTFACSGRPAV